jgi:hypothetical protein
VFSEGEEDIVQLEPQINGLLVRVRIPREMCERHQRLFKACHCFPVGRVGSRFGPSLLEVRYSFIPHLASKGMVGEPLDVVGEAVGVERFEGQDDAGVQGAPALL